MPQEPQLLASLVVLISQPSVFLLLLQSAKPELHAPLQTLAAHEGEAMFVPEQTDPQLPQLLALFVVLISQPSVFLLPLQSANPALHVPLHTPPPQVGDAMLAAEHTAPQLPQLLALVLTLISQPLPRLLSQSAKPLEQAQLKLPTVLVQAMLAPQPPLLTRHSLISLQVLPSPL